MSSISSSARVAQLRLGVGDLRQVQCGGDRVAHLDLALEREHHALGDGERGEQPCVLERTSETEPGPCLRSEVADVECRRA